MPRIGGRICPVVGLGRDSLGHRYGRKGIYSGERLLHVRKMKKKKKLKSYLLCIHFSA